MSTTIILPLDKNPEVADVAQDLSPGDRVYGCFSVRAKDDQSLELRVEEISRTKDELPDAEDYDSDEDDKDEDDKDEETEGTDSKPTDENDGDGSNDQERDEARSLAGGL